MKRLVDGVRRFHDQEFRLHPEYFAHLAAGQKPRYLFITCCDSRVLPHAMTGTGAGDLFLLRNIGNIIPPSEADRTDVEAAVEYALAVLGVAHIIICGHSHCGAMHGLLHPEGLDAIPAVRRWLDYASETRERTLSKHYHLSHDHDALLEAMIEENVIVQLERLRQLPPVRDRLAEGRVELHGWVYKIAQADVLAYAPGSGRFEPLPPSDQDLA